jgi:hypothetical protein
MKGALILYDDQVHKAAIHSYTSEQTSFEVENVQDQDLSTLWKPTATGTDAEVVFDLGSAMSLTSWAILAHTICASGPNRNIRLGVGSTDNGTTFDIVVAYFIDSFTEMDNAWPHICGTFAAVTKRYWRIKIYGTTVPDYQIGGFFLGQRHHFDDEPAQPLRDKWGDSFRTGSKMSGRTEVSEEGGQSREGLIVWSYGSANTADAVREIYVVQKGGYAPVVFADHHATYQPDEGPDPYGPYPHAGEVQYCTLGRPSVRRLKVGDLYRVQMPIRGVF